jgi:hypothetical protein
LDNTAHFAPRRAGGGDPEISATHLQPAIKKSLAAPPGARQSARGAHPALKFLQVFQQKLIAKQNDY